jgi:NAD(P)-dependent dehydrogenase (short-subunit alcohol dehydrogenase family)
MKVLVLGASRGIGHEFVRQYRADDDTVIATARDAPGLQKLRDLGATAIELDVADPASVGGLATQLDGEKIDVALYVAGVYTQAGASQPPSAEEFDRAFHTNVLGAMQAIPRVAPLVEAAGGRFVFITSQMAKIGGVGSSFGWVYRSSKAALNMAVASAQSDYPGAIMVAMSPGWVQTDMGGPGAPLKVQDSVAGMRQAIARLTRREQAAFLDHDGRRFDSW